MTGITVKLSILLSSHFPSQPIQYQCKNVIFRQWLCKRVCKLKHNIQSFENRINHSLFLVFTEIPSIFFNDYYDETSCQKYWNMFCFLALAVMCLCIISSLLLLLSHFLLFWMLNNKMSVNILSMNMLRVEFLKATMVCSGSWKAKNGRCTGSCVKLNGTWEMGSRLFLFPHSENVSI